MAIITFSNGKRIELTYEELARVAESVNYEYWETRELYHEISKLNLPSINYYINGYNGDIEIPEEIIDNRWQNINIYERNCILKDMMASISSSQIDDIIAAKNNVFDRVFAEDFDFVNIKSKRVNEKDIERLLKYFKNHYDRDVVVKLLYNSRTPKNLFSFDDCLAIEELPSEFVRLLTSEQLDKIKSIDHHEINSQLSIYAGEIKDDKVRSDAICYLANHRDPHYRRELAIRNIFTVEKFANINPHDTWGTAEIIKQWKSERWS